MIETSVSQTYGNSEKRWSTRKRTQIILREHRRLNKEFHWNQKDGGTVDGVERPSEEAELSLMLLLLVKRECGRRMLECVCTGLRHLLCKHAYSCFQRKNTVRRWSTRTSASTLSAGRSRSRTHSCKHEHVQNTPRCLHAGEFNAGRPFPASSATQLKGEQTH